MKDNVLFDKVGIILQHDRQIRNKVLDELEKWFESDQISVCMICNQSWDGLVMVCENCGAKRIKDSYLNKIEWYIDYDDFKEKINSMREHES